MFSVYAQEKSVRPGWFLWYNDYAVKDTVSDSQFWHLSNNYIVGLFRPRYCSLNQNCVTSLMAKPFIVCVFTVAQQLFLMFVSRFITHLYSLDGLICKHHWICTWLCKSDTRIEAIASKITLSLSVMQSLVHGPCSVHFAWNVAALYVMRTNCTLGIHIVPVCFGVRVTHTPSWM